jgi:hypothetical protein
MGHILQASLYMFFVPEKKDGLLFFLKTLYFLIYVDIVLRNGYWELLVMMR